MFRKSVAIATNQLYDIVCGIGPGNSQLSGDDDGDNYAGVIVGAVIGSLIVILLIAMVVVQVTYLVLKYQGR